MESEEELSAFVAKVDAFAAGLEPAEQAMFAELLGDDDDVAGFGFDAGWPGLKALAPLKIDFENPIVASGGGNGIFKLEPEGRINAEGGSNGI